MAAFWVHLAYFSVVIHSSLRSHLLEWQTMQSRVEQWGALRGPYLPSTGASELRDRQLWRRGAVVEWRGRGIKVIRHLIFFFFFLSLRSTWGSLLTSSLPGVMELAAAGSRRGRRTGFPPPFFLSFFFKGRMTGQFSQRKNRKALTDSYGSPNTPVLVSAVSCQGVFPVGNAMTQLYV